jgi:hypothetical protein
MTISQIKKAGMTVSQKKNTGSSISQKQAGTPYEMSRLYGVPAGTLANLRYQKRGPKYYKVGKGVFYFVVDFESWLKSKPVLTIDSRSVSND